MRSLIKPLILILVQICTSKTTFKSKPDFLLLDWKYRLIQKDGSIRPLGGHKNLQGYCLSTNFIGHDSNVTFSKCHFDGHNLEKQQWRMNSRGVIFNKFDKSVCLSFDDGSFLMRKCKLSRHKYFKYEHGRLCLSTEENICLGVIPDTLKNHTAGIIKTMPLNNIGTVHNLNYKHYLEELEMSLVDDKNRIILSNSSLCWGVENFNKNIKNYVGIFNCNNDGSSNKSKHVDNQWSVVKEFEIPESENEIFNNDYSKMIKFNRDPSFCLAVDSNLSKSTLSSDIRSGYRLILIKCSKYLTTFSPEFELGFSYRNGVLSVGKSWERNILSDLDLGFPYLGLNLVNTFGIIDRNIVKNECKKGFLLVQNVKNRVASPTSIEQTCQPDNHIRSWKIWLNLKAYKIRKIKNQENFQQRKAVIFKILLKHLKSSQQKGLVQTTTEINLTGHWTNDNFRINFPDKYDYLSYLSRRKRYFYRFGSWVNLECLGRLHDCRNF